MTTTATRPTSTNRAEVERAINLIVGPGNVTEIRALEATTAEDRYPRTWSGYFDDAGKIARAVAQITTAKGIYFVPNAVNLALLARANNRLKKMSKGCGTTDTDIVARRWLLIDCDPQRPEGISANEVERESAHSRICDIDSTLHDAGWPAGIISDSGNGYHLLYRIDLPADDAGLVQRCLQALAARFDDDAVIVDQKVFNPARIWKLYGTLARKGDSTADRPHRLARILNVPDTIEVVPIDLLRALADQAPPDDKKRQQHDHQGSNGRFDLEDFIRHHDLDVDGPHRWNGSGRKWTFRTSPMCGHHDDGPFITEAASGPISAGCHHNSCSWNWHDLRAKYEPRQQRTSGKKQETAPPVDRYEPFPIDCLPEPVRGFIVAGSRAIGCDQAYLALPMLSALAAAIGTTRRARLKKTWSAPAILWTAIIGESGAAKTPAFRLVTAPLRDRERKALEAYSAAMQEYDIQMMHYSKGLAKWKKDRSFDDPPIEPDPPRAERIIVTDITVEALAERLQDSPRGLLLMRDELAGWVGSFDRYAGTAGGDVAHWLSMHSAESTIVDRKKGNPPTIYVDRASVSVTGSIQPGTLRRVMQTAHREAGLLARILLTCPPRKVKRWTEADIDPRAEIEIGSLFERLYELQHDHDDDGRLRPVDVDLTGDAKQQWEMYYNSHNREQAELTGDIAAAWAKLEETAARLALVIHFCRWAAADPQLHSVYEIDTTSMTSGIRLTEWFKHEARRVYAMLSETEEDRDRRELLDWITRKGSTVTVRDLARGPRRYRGDIEAAEQALQDLVQAGYGHWHHDDHDGAPGRPVRRFVLD